MTPGQIVLVAASVGVVGFFLGMARGAVARRRLADKLFAALWQVHQRDRALSSLAPEPDRITRMVDDVRRETGDHQWLRDGRRPTAADVHDVSPEEDR